jgi:hypothetical protein
MQYICTVLMHHCGHTKVAMPGSPGSNYTNPPGSTQALGLSPTLKPHQIRACISHSLLRPIPALSGGAGSGLSGRLLATNAQGHGRVAMALATQIATDP